VFHI